MLDKNQKACIALAGTNELCLIPKMDNRHGLLTGATGMGKTCTCQNMVEPSSARGFAALATAI